jgi:hypothetical protein
MTRDGSERLEFRRDAFGILHLDHVFFYQWGGPFWRHESHEPGTQQIIMGSSISVCCHTKSSQVIDPHGGISGSQGGLCLKSALECLIFVQKIKADVWFARQQKVDFNPTNFSKNLFAVYFFIFIPWSLSQVNAGVQSFFFGVLNSMAWSFLDQDDGLHCLLHNRSCPNVVLTLS